MAAAVNDIRIEPLSKMDEIMGWIDMYSPQIHTKKEEEYKYLEDGESSISIKDNIGNELFIDLGAEFTIGFGHWHAHYCPNSSDFEEFMRDLKGILNSSLCVLTVYCNNKMMGACLKNERITREEALIAAKELLHHEEFIQEMRSYGVTIRCVYWGSNSTRDFVFEADEV